MTKVKCWKNKSKSTNQNSTQRHSIFLFPSLWIPRRVARVLKEPNNADVVLHYQPLTDATITRLKTERANNG